MSPDEIEYKVEEAYDLAGQVIGMAMRVHRTLGPGFLESVYQRALCVELKDAELVFEIEQPITVKYLDVVVGEFKADLIVGGQLIVEIKAVNGLLAAHDVQLVNYLSATGINEGLLLNFGVTSLEFHKKFRVYRQQNNASSL
jgi:GxxExxY protein